MNLQRLDWILKKALDIDLTPWEENFINTFIDRRERLGDKVIVSEAQEEVLERIAAK